MRSYFTGVIGYAFLVMFLVVAGVVFCYSTLFSMSADVTSFYTLMLIFCAVLACRIRLPSSTVSILEFSRISILL